MRFIEGFFEGRKRSHEQRERDVAVVQAARDAERRQLNQPYLERLAQRGGRLIVASPLSGGYEREHSEAIAQAITKHTPSEMRFGVSAHLIGWGLDEEITSSALHLSRALRRLGRFNGSITPLRICHAASILDLAQLVDEVDGTEKRYGELGLGEAMVGHLAVVDERSTGIVGIPDFDFSEACLKDRNIEGWTQIYTPL